MQENDVAELLLQGYSIDAISCKLNLSRKQVEKAMERAKLTKIVRPKGYSTPREEADRVGMHERTVRAAMKSGELRSIIYGGHWYTTHEWVDIWLHNLEYRRRARALSDKVFQDQPTPHTQSADEPQGQDKSPRRLSSLPQDNR